jgi:hypothetical protein
VRSLLRINIAELPKDKPLVSSAFLFKNFINKRRYRMKRHIYIGLAIILSIAAFSLSVSAGTSIQINYATVDLSAETIQLHGVNFDAFGPLDITIGDTLLTACTVNATVIECAITGIPALSGGSWTVRVSAGNSPHTNEEIDVFIPPELMIQWCNAGDFVECYSGDPGTRDVGVCMSGTRTCLSNGEWSGCEGEIIPELESCGDDIDNDCDALTDCDDDECTNDPICSGEPCEAGFDDCNGDPIDGCETNINTDAENCGACYSYCSNNNIAISECAGGVCIGQCETGFDDCNNDKLTDGCETDLGNDPNNCGACGSVCSVANATAVCTGAVCSVATCDSGFGDCDGIDANGCETDLGNDPNNCGACGNACEGGQTCDSGNC